ncbi:MAG: oxaloacetate decarboxylase [Armatimonadota bacterium]|nr:oxaloacetate decarboxylase [Armatimonadota bacterium]MDR7534048.1 oxaloacetate decarboxylase [Armatimonadota bacterium]MDR7534957.1 oxaloacetate decarboxylase [Armatimonadota bacterium]
MTAASLRPSTRLRHRLHTPAIVIAPGAHDALTARIIERAGFEAVYFTGAGFSYTHLGAPDLGLVSLTETVWRLAAVVEATALPVIADAETGYGNALALPRTMREFERAGAAAIQLEDQVAPKRCGHLVGKAVIPTDEMVGKIRAAVDGRQDPDLLIIARTDARAVMGLDAAIERAHRYREAGADVLFVEAPATRDELTRIARELAPPVMANMVEGGTTPLCSAAELEAMGYRLVIFPGAAVRAAAAAIMRLMGALKQQGTTAGMLDEMLSFQELNDLVGLQTYRRLEERYLPRQR